MAVWTWKTTSLVALLEGIEGLKTTEYNLERRVIHISKRIVYHTFERIGGEIEMQRLEKLDRERDPLLRQQRSFQYR